MDAPIIDMHGIVKRFPIGTGEELEVLHGIDLTVRKGEFVAIVGASGSGKSTLMNIIGALDRPTEGTYVLDGVDVGTLRDKQLSRIRCRKIGFVFQTFNLVPRTSALKNVALPMMYNGVRGMNSPRSRAMSETAAARLPPALSPNSTMLSGSGAGSDISPPLAGMSLWSAGISLPPAGAVGKADWGWPSAAEPPPTPEIGNSPANNCRAAS